MGKKLLLLLFALVAGFSLQAAQVTYYVNAATGNDDNDGSQAKPWATLNPEVWATGTDDCVIYQFRLDPSNPQIFRRPICSR
jgi:hypothetical protein